MPIHIQDAPSDVPVEYTNDLQETEADDEVKEAKSRSWGIDSRKAFFEFIFIVNSDGNQPSFYNILIKTFGTHMIENYLNIFQKYSDNHNLFCFKRIWFS